MLFRSMVPGGPCNTVGELMGDAQVAARRMLLEAEDPVLGRHKQLGRSAKFLDGSQDDAEAPAPAPAGGGCGGGRLPAAALPPAPASGG